MYNIELHYLIINKHTFIHVFFFLVSFLYLFSLQRDLKQSLTVVYLTFS